MLADRAPDIFEGVHPSPVLFVHRVRDGWPGADPRRRARGRHRPHPVDPADEPLMAATLAAFERRTGCPWSSTPASTPRADPWWTRPASVGVPARGIDLLVLGELITAAGPVIDVVVPTAGRPSMAALLSSLARELPGTSTVVVVDSGRGVCPLPVPDDRACRW